METIVSTSIGMCTSSAGFNETLCGSGDGSRTRKLDAIAPTDFKSVFCTNSNTPAYKAAIYTCRAASPRSEVYIIKTHPRLRPLPIAVDD